MAKSQKSAAPKKAAASPKKPAKAKANDEVKTEEPVAETPVDSVTNLETEVADTPPDRKSVV